VCSAGSLRGNNPAHEGLVQPYGKDRARESTLIGEFASAVEAFAEIDRLSAPIGAVIT
jgi:hypothetical protein